MPVLLRSVAKARSAPFVAVRSLRTRSDTLVTVLPLQSPRGSTGRPGHRGAAAPVLPWTRRLGASHPPDVKTHRTWVQPAGRGPSWSKRTWDEDARSGGRDCSGTLFSTDGHQQQRRGGSPGPLQTLGSASECFEFEGFHPSHP